MRSQGSLGNRLITGPSTCWAPRREDTPHCICRRVADPDSTLPLREGRVAAAMTRPERCTDFASVAPAEEELGVRLAWTGREVGARRPIQAKD